MYVVKGYVRTYVTAVFSTKWGDLEIEWNGDDIRSWMNEYNMYTLELFGSVMAMGMRL